MRINKYLAECGIASRRASEKLIQDGLVKVNGKVPDLSYDVDIDSDSVTVSGKAVSPPKKFTYIMLHKPKGCVTTVSDDKGRKTVLDYVPLKNVRIFPIGRLDYDTEGLILLTNDGDTGNKLMHPSNKIGKTYVAKIEGQLTQEELAKLREGIELDEGEITSQSKVTPIDFQDGVSRIELIIFEGRNRQVKRMFENIGKTVIFLKRTKIGEIRLGGLSRGEYRYLNDDEINYLKNL